jgi:hypothetical protein
MYTSAKMLPLALAPQTTGDGGMVHTPNRAIFCAHIVAGDLRYIGKEADLKWGEGDDPSVLEFKSTEYGRTAKVVASEDVKSKIRKIGFNRCAQESGFDRKNFVRKLVRGLQVRRSSYNEFMRWLRGYNTYGNRT